MRPTLRKTVHGGLGQSARRLPATVANDRLKRNRKGHVVLQLKSPYCDGTTHIVMAPLQRLAALVPRPRLHLIRFHGVLAPNAKLRAEIVPSAPANTNAFSADHGDASHPSAPARIILAHLGLPARGPPRSPARAFHPQGAQQGRLRPRPASLALGYSPLALASDLFQMA